MHATQVLNVLVVALSAVGAAQALKINNNPQARHGRHQVDIARRQQKTGETQATGQATGQATNTPPTSSSVVTSSTPPPTTSVSSTPLTTPTSSTPQTSDTAETTPPSSTSSPNSTPAPTTRPSSTSSTPTSTTTSTSSTSAPAKTSFFTTTTVVTTTNSEGQSTTYTSESVSTATPGLANSATGSGNTGMTPQTRNTVIGVVVGVGGAIVLAGVAFLALRLYRHRNRGAEDGGDGLMEYNSGFAGGDKAEVASNTGGGSQKGRTPFQSTLESYHAPTQVNTASNF